MLLGRRRTACGTGMSGTQSCRPNGLPKNEAAGTGRCGPRACPGAGRSQPPPLPLNWPALREALLGNRASPTKGPPPEPAPIGLEAFWELVFVANDATWELRVAADEGRQIARALALVPLVDQCRCCKEAASKSADELRA